MDDGRAWLHGFEWAEDCGKWFVLHLYEVKGFFRGIRIVRGHGGNLLADEAHLVFRKGRHVAHEPAHAHTLGVLAGNHSPDAGQALRA